MTDKNEQALAGAASELNAELGLTSKIKQLEQEKNALQASMNLAAQAINELKIELDFERNKNKDKNFIKHWEMTYAGQAIHALLLISSENEGSLDADVVAKEAFKIARSLIKESLCD